MSMDGRCVQVHKFFQNTPRRTQAMDVASHPLWSSVDLVETLLLLADAEGEDQVLPLFTAPLNTLVCVCVCVCVCTCTCIYVHMHIQIHAHIRTHAQTLAPRLHRCPELLLYGLAQCKRTWGPVYVHLISVLCGRYLSNATGNAVMKQVWTINRCPLPVCVCLCL